MIIPVVVDSQSIRWYGKPPEVADNSIQFIQFQFRLSEDWDGLEVVAQFTQTRTYNCLLNNGICHMPVELVAGPCRVSVFGSLGGETIRATTLPLRFNIQASGFVSSAETPIPPTPDLYDQLLEKLFKQNYIRTLNGKSADADGNVEVIPDWSQQYPSAPDFIKNRTHFVEIAEDGSEIVHQLPAKFIPNEIVQATATAAEKAQAALTAAAAAQQTADGAIQAPIPAAVGQTIVVKSIDGDGKPTAWEAVELPDGEAWEHIASISVVEDTENPIKEITQDLGANFRKLRIIMKKYSTGGLVGSGADGYPLRIYGNARSGGTQIAFFKSSVVTLGGSTWFVEIDYNEVTKRVLSVASNTAANEVPIISVNDTMMAAINKIIFFCTGSGDGFRTFPIDIYGVRL